MDVFNQRDLFSTDEVRKTEFDFPGADISLFENFCSKEESDRLYTSLLNNTNWEQDQLLIYGKEIDLSRLTAWHGDTDADESYAHTKSKVLPWTEGLLFIKKRIEQKIDFEFTHYSSTTLETGKTALIGIATTLEKNGKIRSLVRSLLARLDHFNSNMRLEKI